jgi:PAS domain S-box-containing protein
MPEKTSYAELQQRVEALERKIESMNRAREAFKAEGDLFRTMTMNVPVGIFLADAEGHCSFVNERWCEISGLSPREAAGEGWLNSLHPEDRAHFPDFWRRIADSREVHEMEYRFQPPEGGTTWVLGRASAVYDKEGHLTGYRATISDITDRKRMDKALKESERKLSTLMANLQGMAYRCRNDPDWTMLFMSEGCRLLTGYQPSAFIEKRVAYNDLIHPNDREYVWRQVQQSLEKREPFQLRYRIRTATGEEKWIREQGVGVFTDDGRLEALEGLNTDITELITAEARLKEMNEKLEQLVEDRTDELREANTALQASLSTLKNTQAHLVQSEKMAALGDLVAGIAHEINTPVGIGVTAASFLEMKTRETAALLAAGNLQRSQLEKYFDTALEAATSLLTNLNRAADLIRSFKQVAADQTSEERRRFNLKDYIDKILLSLRPQYKRTAHTITVNCPPDIELNSFPGVYSQILSNLILNSLIHGFDDLSEGGITLDASVEGENLRLRYRDNGKGMRPEVVQKIFDPFFTTRPISESTGLGMHIVYNLVTQVLHGRIHCQSNPGQGSEFTITAPLATPQAPSPLRS